MIRSFSSRSAAAIFRDECSPDLPPAIQAVARRKLVQLDLARLLSDLRVPPGNRLEALKGEGKGRHSIRINDQWRLCFRWPEQGVEDVEIVDYH